MNISIKEFESDCTHKYYLGDGAFVAVRHGIVVIYTTDGIEVTNSVYLENSIELFRWLENKDLPPWRNW